MLPMTAKKAIIAATGCVLSLCVAGCQKKSSDWALMVRISGYQLNAYDGLGVLISSGSSKIDYSSGKVFIDDHLLVLDGKEGCWAVHSPGDVQLLTRLNSKQMADLWTYYTKHRETGQFSLDSLLKIMGLAPADLERVFGASKQGGSQSGQ